MSPSVLPLSSMPLHHLPAAVAHDLVHRCDIARRREHEPQGMFGDRGVAVAFDGRYLDAGVGGGGEIDEAASRPCRETPSA